MANNPYKSPEEASKVFDTLTTLLHYKKPKGFTEFSPEIVDFIMRQGKDMECRILMHPGESCTAYAISKTRKQIITGLKVSALFILVPALL